MIPKVISDYVDGAIAQLRRQELISFPGHIPDDMLDPSADSSSGWKGWRPVASAVSDLELDRLELETKIKFPTLYREFLQYQHFINLSELGLRFEQHPSQGWGEILRKAYFHPWPRERILDRGLLPIGSETFMDAGPVCFDSRNQLAGGDYPVVYWDHEWVGTPREVCPLFSSCGKMFECLSAAVKTDVNFTFHLDDDDPTQLPTKRALLRDFLSIDPLGAGGAAKSYWTAWGVDPDASNR